MRELWKAHRRTKTIYGMTGCSGYESSINEAQTARLNSLRNVGAEAPTP